MSLTVASGAVWVLSSEAGQVSRIDSESNEVDLTVDLEVPGPGGIAFGEGSIWVSQPGVPISRIDPADGTVLQQFFGDGGGRVAAAAGKVWVLSPESGRVQRFEPRLIAALRGSAMP
jgi:DNA-binding beta-propeller fold protein YncE